MVTRTAIAAAALFVVLSILLARSMDLSARGQYGAEFLWMTTSAVVLSVASMVLLFRRVQV